jgi:hypothetical protein
LIHPPQCGGALLETADTASAEHVE